MFKTYLLSTTPFATMRILNTLHQLHTSAFLTFSLLPRMASISIPLHLQSYLALHILNPLPCLHWTNRQPLSGLSLPLQA